MTELRLPALRITQSPGRDVYTFGIDGKLLHRFAAVSRLGRDDKAAIKGYQRPEVLAHINGIRTYIESDTPMIPNGIVVAFDSRVRFEPSRAAKGSDSRHGTLVIPLDDDDRPGWIVDGQQRAAAIRDARVDSFPIFVSAFITEQVAEQRAQFILVNSTKPLPKGLIHELLPSTDEPLPLALHKKRLPALLLEKLNHFPDGPLEGRIRTPTSTTGWIKDNSVLKMLENSVSDGALYSYRVGENRVPDIDGMVRLLNSFWSAVAGVFPHAWQLKPRDSRLTHGLGIVSLGFVMDAIAANFGAVEPEATGFQYHLELIEPFCAWTSGEWRFSSTDRRRWNQLQNTPRDIQLVATHLVTSYQREIRTTKSGDEPAASASA